MSQTDPIADFLTFIRNAHMAAHSEFTAPASKMRLNIAKILKEEGYIQNYKFNEKNDRRFITVTLRYDDDNHPVIRHIQRISRPGRRRYCGVEDIPKILNGIGVCIVSTSRGVVSGEKARELGVGGELICEVW